MLIPTRVGREVTTEIGIMAQRMREGERERETYRGAGLVEYPPPLAITGHPLGLTFI